MNKDIIDKIEFLINKWRGKIPDKFTNAYWRYRADRNYYYKLKSELDSKNPAHDDIIKFTKNLFDVKE